MLLGMAISRAGALDATWTTVHLATSALRRGHKVAFMEPWDVEVDDRANLCARVYLFEPGEVEAQTLVEQLHARTAPRRYLRLDTLDALLLRMSPFNAAAMAMAATVQDLGVMVVNDPAGLLRVTHKGWLATLPDVPVPPTLVTQSRGAVQMFYDRHATSVVIKPAQGSGGHGVSLVPPRNARALERAFRKARRADRHVVVQTYLPEAVNGEKRLVWMDGQILGGYLRTRAPGEFRHNLKQGGTPLATTVSATEQALLAPLGVHLLRRGIRLAGIDVIGNHVIEVNALNPGGTFHTDRLAGSDVAGTIIERLDTTRQRPIPGRTTWALHAP
jgi:glutathione synthase